MRIALCSSMVPFVLGGKRNIVERLELVLREHGHEVERVYLPHVDSPELLFRQLAAYRWVDLASSADRIITFRPPAHVIPHPNKVIWFSHHIRQFYDLWDTTFRSFPDDEEHRGIRSALYAADTAALKEATAVFTSSRVVADRLLRWNGVQGEVLYPPIPNPEQFSFGGLDDEIVAVSPIARQKRQHLLIEAMRFTRTDVRLRILGATADPEYVTELHRAIRDARLRDRITIENRWISEEEKAGIIARCLAHACVPLDEDSCGYSTLEAAHASKATLTTDDSGGLLEFVEPGVSGIVTEPNAAGLAEAMDEMFRNRDRTRTLGENARARVDALKITWSHAVDRLLA